jgi:hypothetical protein
MADCVEDWKDQYGLGNSLVPPPDDRRPLLAFLLSLISDENWFTGTICEVIHRPTAERNEIKWHRYLVLYCLHGEIITSAEDGRNEETVIAALDDLRVIFHFGPPDSQLVSLLWDIDYPNARPPDHRLSFEFSPDLEKSHNLAVLALLPPEGAAIAIRQLVASEQISPTKAQRCLLELPPFTDGDCDDLALQVRIHALAGDAYRAWRCIERSGKDADEEILQILVKCRRGAIEELAGLPFTPRATAALEKIGDDLREALRLVRATADP